MYIRELIKTVVYQADIPDHARRISIGQARGSAAISGDSWLITDPLANPYQPSPDRLD